MVNYGIQKKRMLPLIITLRPYLTLATFYMATDALYDLGLLKIPHPYGDILYFARYSFVIAWYSIKLVRNRSSKQNQIDSEKIDQKGGERTE